MLIYADRVYNGRTLESGTGNQQQHSSRSSSSSSEITVRESSLIGWACWKYLTRTVSASLLQQVSYRQFSGSSSALCKQPPDLQVAASSVAQVQFRYSCFSH